jgi:hypothetical protein
MLWLSHFESFKVYRRDNEGHMAEYLAEALCYKSDGRGFDSL